MAHFAPSTTDRCVLLRFVEDLLEQRDGFLIRLKESEVSHEYYKDRCTKLRAKMRELCTHNGEQLKAMQRKLEQCQVAEAKGDSMEVAECVVCWEKPVQVAVVPCGHVCVCLGCSSGLKICPICRRSADLKLELFFS